ncbi:MAG: MBL fold metallo-hydrolase [Chloroflexi bacterium]|nr:MBL fold metallo-hydrolase [Chloroflexota bacterium]
MTQSLIQLTPQLWVAQSKLYATNSSIFISQGQAALIDPGIYPNEITAIARFVTEQNATPQAIIITHSHWDHILGPEQSPGVQVVAQANYVQETSGVYQAKLLRQIADWEAQSGIEREQPFTIPHPDVTFEKTSTLDVGDLSLHLDHTPGHAADELVVYHSESATLLAGDKLSDVEIPYVSDNLAAYEQTLAMLAARDIHRLVPGHGKATTDPVEIQARISADIDYLAALRDQVGQAVRHGRTVEETVELCARISYRYPEENAGGHRLNVESVYVELGGVADPRKVGWGKGIPEK